MWIKCIRTFPVMIGAVDFFAFAAACHVSGKFLTLIGTGGCLDLRASQDRDFSVMKGEDMLDLKH